MSAPIKCGSCTACCKRDTVKLFDDEDAARFNWHLEGGFRVIDRKPNGECIYLTPKGCSIHGDAPVICQSFDCRVLFAETPKEKRRIRIALNPTMREVYDAGKKRISLGG
jgi:Fe-S-cluster containining protein